MSHISAISCVGSDAVGTLATHDLAIAVELTDTDGARRSDVYTLVDDFIKWVLNRDLRYTVDCVKLVGGDPERKDGVREENERITGIYREIGQSEEYGDYIELSTGKTYGPRTMSRLHCTPLFRPSYLRNGPRFEPTDDDAFGELNLAPVALQCQEVLARDEANWSELVYLTRGEHATIDPMTFEEAVYRVVDGCREPDDAAAHELPSPLLGAVTASGLAIQVPEDVAVDFCLAEPRLLVALSTTLGITSVGRQIDDVRAEILALRSRDQARVERAALDACHAQNNRLKWSNEEWAYLQGGRKRSQPPPSIPLAA